MSLIYEKETFKIRNAVFTVYNEMKNGFLESVYHECLELEFNKSNIPFESHKDIEIFHKDNKLNHFYKADFICYRNIIIEIKSVKGLLKEHEAQIINYLKATKLKLGLLVNFGSYPKPEIKRIANWQKLTMDDMDFHG